MLERRFARHMRAWVQVTFVEALPNIMPGFDKEIAKLAQRLLIQSRPIDFHTNVIASKVTPGARPRSPPACQPAAPLPPPVTQRQTPVLPPAKRLPAVAGAQACPA
jgi:hypothetical protein